MRKIGFSLQNSYAAPMPDVIHLLHRAGFDAVSPLWQRDSDLKSIVNAATGCGLTIQSLHGPFRGVTGMWGRDKASSSPILQDLLCAISDCAEYGIPIMVVHPWSGFNYNKKGNT